MINSLSEIDEALGFLHRARHELLEENVRVDVPRVGVGGQDPHGPVADVLLAHLEIAAGAVGVQRLHQPRLPGV